MYLHVRFCEMKIKQFLSVFLAILGLMGCKDDEPLTYYVNQEMLSYCWFPVGSYWIYQEEGTPSLTDSVYVTNTWMEILPDYGEGFQMERYGNGLVMQGKLYGQSRTAWPSATFRDVTETVLDEGYSDSSEMVTDPIFFWDGMGSTVYSGYPEITSRQIDSLTFWGNTYHDLIVVTRTPPQNAERTYETIWARNVGVVRRSLRDGTNWSLLRYHIN